MASVNKVILVGNLGKDPEYLRRRLMSFVDCTDPAVCWNWTGATSRGYGLLSRGWKQTPYKAHRLSYELYIGQIPDGMVVRHRCDNPRCVNPAHLQVGTHRDNVMDRVARHRTNPISLLNLHPGERGIHGAGTKSLKEMRHGVR